MKPLLLALALLITHAANAQTGKPTPADLDARYKTEWAAPAYEAARTANGVKYLTGREKDVYYYLNLARMNPPLFATTYLSGYEGTQKYTNHKRFDKCKQSLMAELKATTPMPLLMPDAALHGTAQCWASYLGKTGKMTHDRAGSDCTDPPRAENIAFGELSALEIVMDMLIDPFTETLGHRHNYLNPAYTQMGLSIQPHRQQGECAVSDF